MTHVTNSFYEDDDGWHVITCRCGWSVEGLPDSETAMDVYGEHCYHEGFGDGQADVAANVREHGAP